MRSAPPLASFFTPSHPTNARTTSRTQVIQANFIMLYYGAFLRDPDGNKVEAVCHRAV
jgi:hypothetical protein